MSQFFIHLEKAEIEAAKQAIETANDDDNWQTFAEFGAWVGEIPELIKAKKAEKHLNALINIVDQKNKIFKKDSEKHLTLKIKRCKSLAELTKLEVGELHTIKSADEKTVYHVNISLQDRIEKLNPTEGSHEWNVRLELENKRKYLQAKDRADKAAWPITIILCLLGVGVVCGIAMFAAFPVIGVVGLIAASLVVGYVEVPVFYAYVKRSMRDLFARGVFEGLDNHLLKEAAKEQHKKDRHEFSEDEKAAILKNNIGWRGLKYGLTVIGGLLSLAATIGFSALAYMQVVEALPVFGITAGIGVAVAPWFFAVLAGLYFFVIFHFIYKAIKHNIFKSIWDEIVKLFAHKDWQAANPKERRIHVAKCIGKGIVIALVIGIAVVATVFTAGAWLQSSVGFFTAAFGMANAVVEKIGITIGLVQLVTSLGFNIENCFKTVSRFGKASLGGIKNKITSYVDEAVKRVEAESFLSKKIGIALWWIVKPIIKFAPLLLHVIGTGLVSAQGTDVAILHPIPKYEGLAKGLVATSQATCEMLEDSHTLMNDEHSHAHHEKSKHEHHGHHEDHKHHHDHEDHKSCDDHEHADPAGDLEWVAGKVVSGVELGYAKCTTLFRKWRGEQVLDEPSVPFDIAVSIRP